jgi:hypothetical protein
MNFEDICWLETLFDKMMSDARKVKCKDQVIAIIKDRYEVIKKEKETLANGMMKNC